MPCTDTRDCNKSPPTHLVQALKLVKGAGRKLVLLVQLVAVERGLQGGAQDWRVTGLKG